MEKAPRSLLDTLRLSAMVRHAAAQLGATMADRLRINATAAFRGMQLHGGGGGGGKGAGAVAGAAAVARGTVSRGKGAGGLLGLSRAGMAGGPAQGGVEYYGVLQSRVKRWQLQARIWALRGAFWLASVLQGLLHRVMPVTALLS